MAAREDALAELETVSRTSERLQSQLSHHLASHGAAMVMRRAAQDGPVSRSYHRLVSGTWAALVVLAIIVALVVVLRVA